MLYNPWYGLAPPQKKKKKRGFEAPYKRTEAKHQKNQPPTVLRCPAQSLTCGLNSATPTFQGCEVEPGGWEPPRCGARNLSPANKPTPQKHNWKPQTPPPPRTLPPTTPGSPKTRPFPPPRGGAPSTAQKSARCGTGRCRSSPQASAPNKCPRETAVLLSRVFLRAGV